MMQGSQQELVSLIRPQRLGTHTNTVDPWTGGKGARTCCVQASVMRKDGLQDPCATGHALLLARTYVTA